MRACAQHPSGDRAQMEEFFPSASWPLAREPERIERTRSSLKQKSSDRQRKFRRRHAICFALLEEVEPSGYSDKIRCGVRRRSHGTDSLGEPCVAALQSNPAQMVLHLCVKDFRIVVGNGLAQCVADRATVAAGNYHS